jgi:hypothetical protein
MDRRIFLKNSALGATVLALYNCSPGVQVSSGQTLLVLEDSHQKVLKSLFPAILGPKIISQSSLYQFESFIQNLEAAISTLPSLTQKEILLLFDLLANRVSRYFLLGLWGQMDDYSTEDINLALEEWSSSSFALRRSAYEGLRDLVLGAWYASPQSWISIGYPGAPIL